MARVHLTHLFCKRNFPAFVFTLKYKSIKEKTKLPVQIANYDVIYTQIQTNDDCKIISGQLQMTSHYKTLLDLPHRMSFGPTFSLNGHLSMRLVTKNALR